jgi:hypothetical protein
LGQPGVRNLDARTMFFYYATGVTPAITMQMVGVGSQYAVAFLDPKVNRSTAARPTRFTCRPTSRRGTSGRSPSMTTRRVRCCRRTSSSRASVVRRKASSATPTLRWVFILVPPPRQAMKRTGRRPFPAEAGTSSSAFTVRSSHGSTKLASRARSNWPGDRNLRAINVTDCVRKNRRRVGPRHKSAGLASWRRMTNESPCKNELPHNDIHSLQNVCKRAYDLSTCQ